MITKEEIHSFFDLLGDRLCNENDASDILYTAIKSSKEMTKIFNIFFGLTNLGKYEIKREYQIGENRPDFFIKPIESPNEESVIIEVKLFDTNYHWDNYLKIKNCKCILLSAHTIPDTQKHAKWSIRYWWDLIKEMENTQQDNYLLISIAKYLRKVCLVKSIEKIELGNPKANLYLNRLIENIIKEKVTPGKQRDDCESHFGWQYYIDISNKPLFWASFTYNYEETFHGMMISIWNCKEEKALSDKLSEHGYQDTLPCKDADKRTYINVRMKNEDFNKFINAQTKEQQKELLETFFDEVNQLVKDYFEGKGNINDI